MDPPHFSFRAVGGSLWPSLCDASVAPIRLAYHQLEATQWLTSDQVLTNQLRQFREVLNHAIKHVPFYQKQALQLGLNSAPMETLEDLRRLPTLSRRLYQEHCRDFVASTLPLGCVATIEPQTSGSSGSPTRIFQTNWVNLWWYAFFLRDLEWCGIDPAGKIASIRSTGKKGSELQPYLAGVEMPSWLPPLTPLIDMGRAYLMDISQNVQYQLAWLRKVQPDYLVSYPSNLAALAELARREGPIKGLRAIQSVSDTLPRDVQQQLESVFGVPVKNTYSCVEAGYLASPCPTGQGFHVHAENVLLEVVNEQGGPCGPGEQGSVLMTTLQNFRSPLIRYELGDRVTLAAAPCPCGRGLPFITQIQGKESPMFFLPDGRRKCSSRLAFQIRKIGGHWQHQVVQQGLDRLVIRVAPAPDWTESHTERLKEEVREFFESPVHIEIELRDKIPLPESGKFQNMIVEMP